MYTPGSFTKNLGIGTDFGKLTTIIANGFKRKLKSTSRAEWRESAGNPDAARDLVPLNFFLCNRGDEVLVDELVEQCIQNTDQIFLERFALFALNLARCGTWEESVGQLTGWHNEFIRTVAWKDGAWHAEAFSKATLDGFINEKVDAVPETRKKIRNNYRYLIKTAGLLEARVGPIDLQPWSWGPSACKLFWDRMIYQGVLPEAPTKANLITSFIEHEIFKLLGCDKELGLKIASATGDGYLEVGSVKRYQ